MSTGDRSSPPPPASKPDSKGSASHSQHRRGYVIGIAVALPLVLAVLALGLLYPVRVAAQSLMMLPEVIPDAPLRPLLWLSVPPGHEEFDYQSATGPIES